MKVGDLVECEQYGAGIIIDATGGSFMAYFCEVGKKGWFSAACLGDSMEIVSEGR